MFFFIDEYDMPVAEKLTQCVVGAVGHAPHKFIVLLARRAVARLRLQPPRCPEELP